MNSEWCVYKVSPSGIRKPLYYGKEEDCRKLCEERDFEYIDEDKTVWYLEPGIREESEEVSQ